MQQEALQRARSCRSLGNMATVIREFSARGIPASEIVPGENVLTFHAWRALGRTVRKGQHGVKVTTWVERSKEKLDAETGERKIEGYKMPRAATVFHVSQTEALS